MMQSSVPLEIRKKWKPRAKKSHKGDFGRVFILAGSRGLAGAAHLTSMAALRSGAGLVSLGVPESIYVVLARKDPEIMVKPLPASMRGSLSGKAAAPVRKFLKNQDVLAVGPGLSQDPAVRRLIRLLLRRPAWPVVLDADGINAYRNHSDQLPKVHRGFILTPHPGEFVRVFGGKLSDSLILRRKRAVQVAIKYRIFIVLKGHRTIVASPQGDVYVNSTGNPGMAKGGSGDVLTGMIAALIAQKFSLWDAARWGVFLHGMAGDLAAGKMGEAGMTAGDILQNVPVAIRKIRGC